MTPPCEFLWHGPKFKPTATCACMRGFTSQFEFGPDALKTWQAHRAEVEHSQSAARADRLVPVLATMPRVDKFQEVVINESKDLIAVLAAEVARLRTALALFPHKAQGELLEIADLCTDATAQSLRQFIRAYADL